MADLFTKAQLGRLQSDCRGRCRPLADDLARQVGRRDRINLMAEQGRIDASQSPCAMPDLVEAEKRLREAYQTLQSYVARRDRTDVRNLLNEARKLILNAGRAATGQKKCVDESKKPEVRIVRKKQAPRFENFAVSNTAFAFSNIGNIGYRMREEGDTFHPLSALVSYQGKYYLLFGGDYSPDREEKANRGETVAYVLYPAKGKPSEAGILLRSTPLETFLSDPENREYAKKLLQEHFQNSPTTEIDFDQKLAG